MRPGADGRAEVLVGEEVGYTDEPEARPRVVRVVERRHLSETVRRAAGIELPEDAIDGGRFPRVLRAARAASLVYVDEAQAELLSRQGVSCWTVTSDLDDEGGALLAVRRGEGRAAHFSVSRVLDAALARASAEGSEEAAGRFGASALPLTHDHVLRSASGGALSRQRLELAVALALAVHPDASSPFQLSGELARVTPGPERSSPEEKLARWEEWLEAIEFRALRFDAWLPADDAALPRTEPAREALSRRGVGVLEFPEVPAGAAATEILPSALYLVAEGVLPWRPAFRRTPPGHREVGRGTLGLLLVALVAAALVLWSVGRAREAAERPRGIGPPRGAPAQTVRLEDEGG